MSLMIGAVVIVIIIAGAAFFMSTKNTAQSGEKNEAAGKQESKRNETKVMQEKTEYVKTQAVKAEERKANVERDKKEAVGEKEKKIISEKQTEKNVEKSDFREKNKQKEQLYYYINHELQTLFNIYNNGEWDNIQKLGEIEPALYKEKEEIIEGLPSFTGTMVKKYFSCIDFKEENDKIVGYIKDKEHLKEAFLQFMMPFYPYYYKQLSEGGLHHTALLQPNTLRLFQQLTGKKFRPGYRNRYTTGVRAFEWDKNCYKVYRKDGKLLCDAVFGTDGIIEGYGQKKYIDETHPDWNIIEEGNWKDGRFKGTILRYEYKKSVK